MHRPRMSVTQQQCGLPRVWSWDPDSKQHPLRFELVQSEGSPRPSLHLLHALLDRTSSSSELWCNAEQRDQVHEVGFSTCANISTLSFLHQYTAQHICSKFTANFVNTIKYLNNIALWITGL